MVNCILTTLNILLECQKKIRLEKTLIHSDVKDTQPVKSEERPVDFYAINIMTSQLTTEPPETSIKLIKEKMTVLGAHHIPIVQNFRLLGLISDRDLLKIDQSSTFYFLKAIDIMTTVLVVCDEETPIEHIAKVLLEEKISCLPVVDKNHRLTGLITRSDILRVVIENRLILI